MSPYAGIEGSDPKKPATWTPAPISAIVRAVDRAEEILDFWFGAVGDDGYGAPEDRKKRWWTTDPEFDEECRSRFFELHGAACRGALSDWERAARPSLALVILLDQLSRNLHRKDPRAWAQDGKAQRIALEALQKGFEAGLRPIERVFLYMPFMHAEDMALQDLSVACFQRLVDEAPAAHREKVASNLKFAHQHRDIVARFGRYPHRNAVLGRATTPEEAEFLKEPGSSF